MLGWLFGQKPTRESLHGHKRVKVGGMAFTIRRLAPLSDFPADRMPMVFSDTTRHEAVDMGNQSVIKRVQEDMRAVVQAGVVDPPLNQKDGISVADLFRDPDVGYNLYSVIMEHSLLHMAGKRIQFFFLAAPLLRFTIWLRSTARGLARSLGREPSLA